MAGSKNPPPKEYCEKVRSMPACPGKKTIPQTIPHMMII